MSAVQVADLVNDITVRTERLKAEITTEHTENPPFRDIQALQRTLRTLEQELRESGSATRGDAC